MTFARGKEAQARKAAKAKRPANLVPKNTGRSDPKYKTVPRSTEHMARIAARGCLICGRPAQAHHCDVVLPKGMGPKVSDFCVVPLCPTHHTDDKHDCAHGYLGERAWWARHGVDVGAWIVALLVRWYYGQNPDAQAAIDAIEAQRRKLAA